MSIETYEGLLFLALIFGAFTLLGIGLVLVHWLVPDANKWDDRPQSDEEQS